jgi:pantothenate kinase-related protein Tda10
MRTTEQHRVYCREWRKNNPEKVKAHKQKWISKHKEEIKKYHDNYNHQYYLNNIERIRKSTHDYYYAHKTK